VSYEEWMQRSMIDQMWVEFEHHQSPGAGDIERARDLPGPQELGRFAGTPGIFWPYGMFM
jgi:hypothetical protein